jgi:hypothetical protein
MNQIKNTFLRKKTEHITNRNVWLKHPLTIKSILLISDNESKSLKRKTEELFPNASVYHLFLREIKEDRSTGFYYSVHTSDFNLTGKLKNDKLINLEQMPTELLLDLSGGSELLRYFVNRSVAAMKIGDLMSKNASNYDFMVQFTADPLQSLENIYSKLTTLTQDASEQP